MIAIDRFRRSPCSEIRTCPTASPLCSVNSSGASSYSCAASCPAATPDQCGNTCVSLQSDVQNCKTCGTACSYAHAAGVCTQGMCSQGSCLPGYAHCSSDPASGCETYVMGSDAANCGGCNVACKVGQICKAGSCSENGVTCSSPGITCKQAGCYQSGRYSISAGGGIVVDLMNGRRLITRATRGPLALPDAKNDCATLVLEGINAWRLPAYDELSPTLYMAGVPTYMCTVCDPSVDQAAFPDIANHAPNYYYLTTTYNSGKAGYDTVYYCDGRNNYPNPIDTPTLFFCVHDPLP